jgi:hypothetical protein
MNSYESDLMNSAVSNSVAFIFSGLAAEAAIGRFIALCGRSLEGPAEGRQKGRRLSFDE